MSNITIPKLTDKFIVSTLGFAVGFNRKKDIPISLDIMEVKEYNQDHNAFLVFSSNGALEFECYIQQNKYTKLWYIYDINTILETKERKEVST